MAYSTADGGRRAYVPFAAVKGFRALLDAGTLAIGPGITLKDAVVTDAVADDCDFLWYDQEHSTMSPDALQNHIFAAHGRGVPVIVRIQGPNVGYAAAPGVTQPWGMYIKSVLDAGADGVIVPQVRTADEVKSIVADCRYPTGSGRNAPFDRDQGGLPTVRSAWLLSAHRSTVPPGPLGTPCMSLCR